MTADPVAARRVSWREYRLEFPAETASVPVTRGMVRLLCSAWEVPQEAAYTTMLLASEIITNAVVVSGGEVLRMTLRQVLDYLYFDCDDHDPVIPETPAMPDGEELSGRGLPLVEELASTCGWDRLTDRQGKVRWFTLAVR